jgi:hypothetical protein
MLTADEHRAQVLESEAYRHKMNGEFIKQNRELFWRMIAPRFRPAPAPPTVPARRRLPLAARYAWAEPAPATEPTEPVTSRRELPPVTE